MFRLLKVADSSLTPDFEDGDYVVATRIPILFRAPRPGQVVVFRQAEYGTMIKRVERVLDDENLFVVGTHTWSVDSRQFGPVKRSDVIGVVVLHIRRPERSSDE